jgi:methylmalonyl-CoA mutase N-terminal domain/subunit
MRLVTDIVAFCTESVPKWNTISVSGYHIREAGATAAQELAFTLRDGIEYVQHAVDAGLDVDRFAPRISFFFNAHNDLLEEVAKYRAARRLWAHVMRDRFGARDPKSWQLRFHAQTAGVSLTAQQPANNLVRTAVQALAAVLGGAQSLHTNALDEALALPTEDAALLALRTQQIWRTKPGSPSGRSAGRSYCIERLTADLEAEARRQFEVIDAMGGMVAAIEAGYPQREIAESAYRDQQAVESRPDDCRVNAFVATAHEPVETLYIDEAAEREQRAALDGLRRERDAPRVQAAL